MATDKILIGALRECETQEQVEDIFSRFNVSDFVKKTDCIIKSMGVTEAFFCGKVDDESAYLTHLSAFLTGTWKDFQTTPGRL